MCCMLSSSFLFLIIRHRYLVCLLVACLLACLTSQQHASVSQGRICTDKSTCCHTEIEVANQTFSDTRPTSLSTDPIMPSAWQGSHWSANFEVTGMTRRPKNLGASRIRTQDLSLSRRTPLPLGQRCGHVQRPFLCLYHSKKSFLP